MENKIFISETKESNEKDLTVTSWISTETRDRGGDIVRADGMVLSGKPVVLQSHGHGPLGSEPIARPLWIKPGQHEDKKGILAKTKFFPDETGKRLWAKTTQGYMPNWSIGFQILEKKDLSDGGRDILKWELLEYSLVGVPMQPDAQTIGAKSMDGKTNLVFKVSSWEGENILPFLTEEKIQSLVAEVVRNTFWKVRARVLG